MDKYELGIPPIKSQRRPEKLLKELGHHPYRPKQPNGWSDISEDWLSPELLIRRLVYARQSYNFTKPNNNNLEFYEKIVSKNFDNKDKIINFLNKKNRINDKQTILFNHPEFLKA